jgi:hypothetical protein
MHDQEKSDSGIVVTKPTNKAGPPVAESVEPRLGTKGNADQQSTHRAQSQARVTQALGRVRRAARQRLDQRKLVAVFAAERGLQSLIQSRKESEPGWTAALDQLRSRFFLATRPFPVGYGVPAAHSAPCGEVHSPVNLT